jgi:hypothetical protein
VRKEDDLLERKEGHLGERGSDERRVERIHAGKIIARERPIAPPQGPKISNALPFMASGASSAA